MKETSVEERLISATREMGGECIKLLPWSTTGLPDRLSLLPDGIAWFIETKTDKGRLRPRQRWWRDRLQTLGLRYTVLRSPEEVNSWHELNKTKRGKRK